MPAVLWPKVCIDTIQIASRPDFFDIPVDESFASDYIDSNRNVTTELCASRIKLQKKFFFFQLSSVFMMSRGEKLL